MSKQILQALMQLFAIVAPPDSNLKERIAIVRSFLLQQLNKELVDGYLRIFSEYYQEHLEANSDFEIQAKKTSSSSVRILKICDEINHELTQKQKFIVLFLLLEFVNSDNYITVQEIEFTTIVSSAFHIKVVDYELVADFVLGDLISFPDNPNILIINNEKENNTIYSKHIYSETLAGQIRILHITSSDLFVLKFFGETELYLNNNLMKLRSICRVSKVKKL